MVAYSYFRSVALYNGIHVATVDDEDQGMHSVKILVSSILDDSLRRLSRGRGGDALTSL